jgi:cytochrome c
MRRKLIFTCVTVFCINFLIAGSALADKKADLMALLQKGNDYIAANGIEKAVEAFPKDEFWNDDLYIFAYNYKGDCIAHGLKPKKVGKNFIKLKSPEGKYHIKKLVEIAKAGGDWYEYRWMHPKKKKLMGKVSFIKPIDGMDAFIGCGYWKE